MRKGNQWELRIESWNWCQGSGYKTSQKKWDGDQEVWDKPGYKLSQRECFKEKELINCFSKIQQSTSNFFESSFVDINGKEDTWKWVVEWMCSEEMEVVSITVLWEVWIWRKEKKEIAERQKRGFLIFIFKDERYWQCLKDKADSVKKQLWIKIGN